jgi:hypothetical protein
VTFVQSLRSSSPFPRALAILLAAGSLSLGCADAEETLDEESSVDDLTTDTKAIAPGSFQEEAVLLVAGDRALGDAEFKTKVKITATATKSILAYRNGKAAAPDDDGYFKKLADLDGLTGTTATFYKRVLEYAAKTDGYLDGGATVTPDKGLFQIPDNLGRPPTSNDVTVVKGLDGRTSEEAYKLFRGRVTNRIAPSNEAIARSTFLETHRLFNISLANFFAANSPTAAFVKQLGAKTVMLKGLLTGANTNLMLEATFADGRVVYYQKNGGNYAPVAKPTYQVIMRSPIVLTTPGVRVFYPAWSAPQLATGG